LHRREEAGGAGAEVERPKRESAATRVHPQELDACRQPGRRVCPDEADTPTCGQVIEQVPCDALDASEVGGLREDDCSVEADGALSVRGAVY
jgi:hypothetical protein